MGKTKTFIVDYRKQRVKHATIHIDEAVAERVVSCKFLSVHIAKDLSWSKHTNTVVKRARQHLFPIRRLKRFVMDPQILKMFYSCTIESILTGCITAWHGNCLASDSKALQRVGCMASSLSSRNYARLFQRKALRIVRLQSPKS